MPSDIRNEVAALESLGTIVDRFTANLSREPPTKGASLSSTEANTLRKSIYEVLFMATGMTAAQGVLLLPAMDEYLQSPNDQTWRQVLETADRFLPYILAFIEDIASIQAEYTLEPEYREIFASAFSRRLRLQTILAQVTPPDVAEFGKVRDQYRLLVTRLEDATAQLAVYEKNKRSFEERQKASQHTQAEEREFKFRTTKGQHGVFVVIAILVVLAGVAFAGAGVWLVVGAGEKGSTEMTLLGQTIKTSSVGVAAIFIGAVIVALTLRRILKTLVSTAS